MKTFLKQEVTFIVYIAAIAWMGMIVWNGNIAVLFGNIRLTYRQSCCICYLVTSVGVLLELAKSCFRSDPAPKPKAVADGEADT